MVLSGFPSPTKTPYILHPRRQYSPWFSNIQTEYHFLLHSTRLDLCLCRQPGKGGKLVGVRLRSAIGTITWSALVADGYPVESTGNGYLGRTQALSLLLTRVISRWGSTREPKWIECTVHPKDPRMESSYRSTLCRILLSASILSPSSILLWCNTFQQMMDP